MVKYKYEYDKIGKIVWTLDWLRERIHGGHHRTLTKYLTRRSPEQKAEADAAGLTVEVILRDAFKVENGRTSVPDDAATVLKRVEGATPEMVYPIFAATGDKRPERFEIFIKGLAGWAKRTGGDPKPWLDLLSVEQTITS